MVEEVGREFRGDYDPDRRRLLLVEDEALIRQVTRRYLGLIGYQVLEAATGAEALKKIEDDAPDIMVLDYNLPDCIGVDLYRRIVEKYWAIPAILVSAYELDRETLRAADELEIGGFLRKPYGFSDLNAMLRHLAGKRRIFPLRPRRFVTRKHWYSVRPGYLSRQVFRKMFRDRLDPGGHVHFYIEGYDDHVVLLCNRQTMGKVIAKSPRCGKGECIKWEASQLADFEQEAVLRELSQEINLVKVDAADYEMSWPTLADFLCWLELND